jgi:predicted GNAT family acetyltransferase
MPTDIEYERLQNGNGFCAKYHGHKIGEIDIVTIGANRIIIESTTIDDNFRDTELCRNLVQCVADFARRTHKKILSLCPRAQSIFNRYPEFDDVRLISAAE